MLTNQASHHIDLLEWMMGDVESVFAHATTALADIEAEDTAVVTVKFKIPSFIATLGMLFMARSIAVVISGGFPPSVPKDLPTDWLVGRVDMLRVSIFWLIGIALICNYMLKKTNFGSWVYATGENQEAAKTPGTGNTQRRGEGGDRRGHR